MCSPYQVSGKGVPWCILQRYPSLKGKIKANHHGVVVLLDKAMLVHKPLNNKERGGSKNLPIPQPDQWQCCSTAGIFGKSHEIENPLTLYTTSAQQGQGDNLYQHQIASTTTFK